MLLACMISSCRCSDMGTSPGEGDNRNTRPQVTVEGIGRSAWMDAAIRPYPKALPLP